MMKVRRNSLFKVPVQRCVPHQLMSLIHPLRMNVSAKRSHLNVWQVRKEHPPAQTTTTQVLYQRYCRDNNKKLPFQVLNCALCFASPDSMGILNANLESPVLKELCWFVPCYRWAHVHFQEQFASFSMKYFSEVLDLDFLCGHQETNQRNICIAPQAINTLHMTQFQPLDIMLFISQQGHTSDHMEGFHLPNTF